MSAGRTTLRRRAFAHLAIYAVDMAIAMTGFIVGFGLEVKNWWALILIGILGRWVLHTANGVLMRATATERAREEIDNEGAPQ